MEEVACDLCGADEYAVVATRGRFGMPLRTVICRRCGLVYTNPRPSPEQYEEFYQKRYWGMYKRADVPDERFFQKRVRRITRFFQELRPWVAPGACVLDVGCGVGALLHLLSEHGATCVGIEPHEEHSRFARERTGAEVFAGTFEEAAGELRRRGARFDVVVFRHVLEHMTSPTRALKLARELLREEGVVFLETPNVMYPGQALGRFFQLAHPYNFSAKTMALLLRKCGFAPLEIRELDDWTPRERLQAVAQRAPAPEAIDFAHEGQDWREVVRRLRRHRWLYPLTLGSLRKKLAHLDRLLGRA